MQNDVLNVNITLNNISDKPPKPEKYKKSTTVGVNQSSNNQSHQYNNN